MTVVVKGGVVGRSIAGGGVLQRGEKGDRISSVDSTKKRRKRAYLAKGLHFREKTQTAAKCDLGGPVGILEKERRNCRSARSHSGNLGKGVEKKEDQIGSRVFRGASLVSRWMSIIASNEGKGLKT